MVRPYAAGDEFQRVLDTVTLKCASQSVVGGATGAVSEEEYLNFPFTLALDADDGQLRDAACSLDVKPDDVDLVVLALAPRLRMFDIVQQIGLTDAGDVPRSIELTTPVRPRALRSPFGGLELRVFFCLNSELAPRPLRPWRKGTWLGSQEFRLRTGLAGAGFIPLRLTDEERVRLDLPNDVARFATLDDGDPFDPDATNAVKLYVDGDLLDRLAVGTGTPVGKHIQRQLFVDVASAIVFAAQARLTDEPMLRDQHVDDFSGSLVHRLVEVVVGRSIDAETSDRRQSEYRRMCTTPTSFLAQIEAKTGMRRDMLASFGDVQ